MKTIYLYSHRIDWRVSVFIGEDKEDYAQSVGDILMELGTLGIDSDGALRAYENLSSEKPNNGLCYSNYGFRESVIVVGWTKSPNELFNTLIHEFIHLSGHISDALGLSITGEELAYVIGDLSKDLYPHISKKLCGCNKKRR